MSMTAEPLASPVTSCLCTEPLSRILLHGGLGAEAPLEPETLMRLFHIADAISHGDAYISSGRPVESDAARECDARCGRVSRYFNRIDWKSRQSDYIALALCSRALRAILVHFRDCPAISAKDRRRRIEDACAHISVLEHAA